MECKCYIKEEEGVEPQIIKCPLCKSASDLFEKLEKLATFDMNGGDGISDHYVLIQEANQVLADAVN